MITAGQGWTAAAVATAAAASTCGWAPLCWWPLIPVAFSVLLYALMGTRSPWAAWWLGWTFGTVSQLVGHRWMYSAMTSKAGIDALSALLQFGALGMYLGLSTGLAALSWKLLHGTSAETGRVARLGFSALSFAALFTLAEWTRSIAFGGFSSLSVGYAFADTWMRGYIPMGGVWCASFTVLLSTAFSCLAPLMASRGQQVVVSLTAALIVASGAGLAQVSWVHASGPPLSFRLLQPNVAQDLKFDPAYITQQLDTLTTLLEAGPADIIVAPETAVPLFFTQLPAELIGRWQAWSSVNRSHLFLGMPMLSETGAAHNATLHISPDASALSTYRKVRLMPFGEYTPAGLGWVTRDLAIPLKDLVPGPADQAPFRGPGDQGLGMLVCQEELMGKDARRAAAQASVILNPTNLAWFDDSSAIAQGLQIVRVRAMETGRPILRSANTGVTAHIDHKGQLKAAASEHHHTVLSGLVQPMEGPTPYARWGEAPLLVLALAWLGSIAVTIRFRFVHKHP